MTTASMIKAQRLEAALAELKVRELLQSTAGVDGSVRATAPGPAKGIATSAKKIELPPTEPAPQAAGEATPPNDDGGGEELAKGELAAETAAPANTIIVASSSAPNDADDLRLAGNEALEYGRLDDAFEAYTQALELAAPRLGADTPDAGLATTVAQLYSNRSAALLLLGRAADAESDALAAAGLRPEWPKAHYRLAQARVELGAFRLAVAAARRGEALLAATGDRSAEFVPLLDDIARLAALQGSTAGFDGRLLEVRSAGEDAWLCREAPADPLLDAAGDEEGDDDGGSLQPAFVTVEDDDGLENFNNALATERPLSFRSVAAAMEAARDGDRIVLLRGVHNFSGSCVDITKRVLVRGEGSLRDASIDQRANAPIFRALRTCVLQNLHCDLSGFREAVLVDGGDTVRPVIDGCIITASGADAMVVSGRAAPTVRNCELRGRRNGLALMGESRGEWVDCLLNGSTLAGVKAQDRSRPTLRGCHVQANKEEGVVAADSSHVELIACHVRDNLGPGVDASGRAGVTLRGCWVRANVGGAFLWDAARLDMRACRLGGGASLALLVDGPTPVAHLTDCVIDGAVHADEATWGGLRAGGNRLAAAGETPDGASHGLPMESGPFKFEADKYTRKQ